jgi:NADH-quinone oxidoreductase subunit L
MYEYTIYIVLLPFLGFLINGLLGKKLNSEKLSGIIGSGVVGISFVLFCVIFLQMLQGGAEDRLHNVQYFMWLAAGSLDISFAYQIDQLSIVMALIVTGVGFLIHVYSIGYMRRDPGFWRFFAYLNLFIFAMLTLVLADNFVLLFLGWEGVGLCSYLLIGFWHDRKFDKGTTSDAAKKAFIVNRIGDFGFLFGMFLIFKTFGSLNFDTVFAEATSFTQGNSTIVWITLLLFLGAVGKSAQIPLYVWLPDAMAGPTPVSALIHAATMVTAGVYMVARCSVLYALAPATMTVVAIIGAATAVYAATVGLVQNDIKKVLAYSTISQLGYMFLALGVGAFSAGIFHLMTHAFFKALLFLGAGAVIHAMSGEQNIQKFGGLRSALPTTYKTFLAAAFAISGIFPFSGFFSKDEILWKAFEQGSTLYYLVGLGGAAMTAFYIFRLVSLTFEGERRWEGEVHPHEAPKVMTIPLIMLAVLSLVGGIVGIPESLGGHNALRHWLEPVFTPADNKLLIFPAGEVGGAEYILMIVSLGVAIGGVLVARNIFLKRREVAIQLASRWNRFYQLLVNKYYVDEIYDAAVVNPVVKGSEKVLWAGFDMGIIDGAVNGTAKLIAIVSQFIRRMQTGVTQGYALSFIIGVIFVLGWLIFG